MIDYVEFFTVSHGDRRDFVYTHFGWLNTLVIVPTNGQSYRAVHILWFINGRGHHTYFHVR